MSLAVFVSCQSVKKEQKTGTGTETEQGAKSIEVAESVQFEDVNGKHVNTASLKGKVVFINFWATWCPPCIKEMPSIQALYNKFNPADDIVFLLVDVDGDLEKSSAFMKNNQLNMPIYKPTANLPSSFIQGAIPTTVILDKNGAMKARIEGGRDYNTAEMENEIRALLKE